VSKSVKLSPKRKKPAAGKSPPRKIGRDLFAVLVVGMTLALGFAWVGIDTSKVGVLINNASAKVQQLASDKSSRTSNASDEFPVSSIGGKTRIKQGDVSRYPVCSGGATRLNCVVDGDTFHMDGATVRISDIDAPETHPPRCAREADLGDRATTRLSQLLSAGPFQLVRHDRDRDKYGRQLRVVIRDGRSIGRMLVGEGLARPWTGKRRPWCGGNDTAAG
jgi:endonuclease YncB( thermonuclease family)